MTHRVLLAALAALVWAAPAAAQWASDFPGVPRAAISIVGSSQHRSSLTFTGYKLSGTASGSDTLAGGLRVALGRSYRIQSEFEVGWDMTLLDGYVLQPPSGGTAGAAATSNTASQTYMRGLAGYAIRIGAKYRPIVSVDPDGNGYEVAFGGGFQPQLKPFFGIEKRGDSTRTGGQFNSTAVTSNAVFKQNPFTGLTATTLLAAMGSYRTKRLLGDAALVVEKGPDRNANDPSPIQTANGLALKAGGSYRLTPGLAVGAAYWGTGSPPWWDEVQFSAPGKVKSQQYGLILQLGSDPESGLDLMFTSPTGSYGQSGRLYLRFRSTE